jgi:hypothetical protein
MPDDERLNDLREFFKQNIKTIDVEDIMNMVIDPYCQLEFDGHNLKWISGSGSKIHSWPAISGNNKAGKEKDSYRYDPNEYQSQPGGPTPEGRYEIGFPEIKSNNVKTFLRAIKSRTPFGGKTKTYNWNVAGSGGSWGKYRFYLYPAGHDALGRKEMYIHGGTVPGSIGCIDLMNRIKEFGYVLAAWMLMSSLVGGKSKQTTPIYIEVNYDNWVRKENLPDTGRQTYHSIPDKDREVFDGDY